MKPAPYTPETLNLIRRRRATAAELGWDQAFYLSICRKHGIDPVSRSNDEASKEGWLKPYTPPVRRPPPPSEQRIIEQGRRVRAKRKKPDPKPYDPDAPCIYDLATRTLRRGPAVIALRARKALAFAVLAGLPDGEMIKGDSLNHRIGAGASNAGNLITTLKEQIAAVGLTVYGQRARHNSGYCLHDLKSGQRIRIKIKTGGREP